MGGRERESEAVGGRKPPAVLCGRGPDDDRNLMRAMKIRSKYRCECFSPALSPPANVDLVIHFLFFSGGMTPQIATNQLVPRLPMYVVEVRRLAHVLSLVAGCT